MITSALGRHAITLREGYRLEAYRDTRRILTIGVGHTSAAGPPMVTEDLTITMAQCDAILSHDLRQTEEAVNDAVTRPLTQNQFDACVSLAFNIGARGFAGSSVVRFINDGEMDRAADAFMMWDKPPELVGRREGEKAQFLRPDAAQPAEPGPEPSPALPVFSISALQTRLNELGAAPPLAIDDDYGEASCAAVKSFQAAHHLVADGLVGPDTVAALGIST